MVYNIDDVKEKHIEAIERIERSCFSLPWTREQLLSQAADDRCVFLAALGDGDKVLGYVGMTYVIDEGYISNVATAPEYRRKGIADALLDELLRRAEKLKLAFLTLEVRESNGAAIALYSKHGFAKVGVRKNYYTKPAENAVLMTKFLK